jgi:hypothetical protein
VPRLGPWNIMRRRLCWLEREYGMTIENCDLCHSPPADGWWMLSRQSECNAAGLSHVGSSYIQRRTALH